MHIVLVEPEIPGNTGSIARLCAGTRTPLHLVGRLGFSLEDRYLRRAGLDYWPHVELHRHDTLEEVLGACGGPAWFFTKKAERCLWDVDFGSDDLLVFGRETTGLSDEVLDRHADRLVRIPIDTGRIRSLNLASAVSIALYEALRQQRVRAGGRLDAF